MRDKNRTLILIAAVFIAAVLTAAALWGQGGAAIPAGAAEIVETAFPAAAAPRTARTAGPSSAPVPDSEYAGKIRITEIMMKNRAAGMDEDGEFPDWIELQNVSDEDVDLAFWRIADRADRRGWFFPEVTLASGQRLLVFASGKNRAEADGALHTDFALSEKDSLWLYDAAGFLADTAACADCETDVSLVRQEDGSWEESLYPSPGYENGLTGYKRWQRTLSAAGPLIISEVAVRNFGAFTAGTSDSSDWAEIRNISENAVNLGDYYLSDKAGERLFFRLPEQELAPGACMLVICDSDPDVFYGSTPCAGFKLDDAHDQLFLSDGAGRIIDFISLRDIPAGGSYGRLDDRPGFYYFTVPTPGRENAEGFRTVSPLPVSLTPDGIYEDTEELWLELEDTGHLRYTVNGSAPTEESEPYTGPIHITETSVVCVKNFAPGAVPSRTLALTFLLNEGHELPVVSFVAENFDDFDGIYKGGAKGTEVPGTLSFFRGEERVSAPCGISLNGETSLVLFKKNMAVHFRGAYGQSALEHDLFGGGATAFTDLLIRAGQDQYQAEMRNELAQYMAEKAESRVVNQRSLYCALYLNGEYAGLFTLKERPNAALYAAYAGVEKNRVEIFEAPVPFGTDFYQDVVSYANTHDMSDPDSYRRFCAVVDIDSLIDWLFLEGYCANTDITSGNLRYARSDDADGRWHLIFYDLDAAFRNVESVQSNLLNEYGASHIQVAAFSVPLMQNADFRDRFLTRAAELLSGPLTNEALLAEIDRIADEIRPELIRDYARLDRDIESWDWNLNELRSMIIDHDWRQCNIDGICRAFELSAQERAQYFGDIDARPAGEEDA